MAVMCVTMKDFTEVVSDNMKLSQLFKKKKSDKIKMPIRRIVSNNIFMLRMAHRSVPGLLLCDMVVTVGAALTSFLTATYMLRYALNGSASPVLLLLSWCVWPPSSFWDGFNRFFTIRCIPSRPVR